MKVELKVNLKIGSGIINAGRKYDDEIEEFPEYIVSNLENPKVIKVLIPAKDGKEEKPKLNKKSKD